MDALSDRQCDLSWSSSFVELVQLLDQQKDFV
jgi:hypothetical protein